MMTLSEAILRAKMLILDLWVFQSTGSSTQVASAQAHAHPHTALSVRTESADQHAANYSQSYPYSYPHSPTGPSGCATRPSSPRPLGSFARGVAWRAMWIVWIGLGWFWLRL